MGGYFVIFVLSLVCYGSTQRRQVITPTEGPTVAIPQDVLVIFASKTIRPGCEFTAHIKYRSPDNRRQLTVEISLINSKNETVYTKSDRIRFNNPSGRVRFRGVGRNRRTDSHTMTLTAPADLPAGNYKLKGKTSIRNGNIIEVMANVKVVSKTTSIFIQLDKGIYRPSQKVNFRAIVVKPDLTPYRGTCDVEMSDANRNKIKQWKDVRLVKGLLTLDLELSDQPVLGTWKVKVTTDMGTESEKTFEVDEYVLPKFEVTSELSSFLLLDQNSVKLTVSAEYTFGKEVDGFADIRLKNGASFARGPFNRATRRFDSLPALERKNVKLVNGKAVLAISIDLIKPLFGRSDGRIFDGSVLLLEANVTELLTGIKRAADGVKSTFHQHREKLEFISSPSNYKPGFKYTAFLKLSSQDGGVIVNPEQATVEVEYRSKVEAATTTVGPPGARLRSDIFFPQFPRTTSKKLPKIIVSFPENGLQKIEFDVPANATDRLSLQAVYKEQPRRSEGPFIQRIQAFHSAQETKSPTRSYVQVNLASSNTLKAGAFARFDISLSPEDVGRYIDWNIIARGKIVASGRMLVTRFSSVLFQRVSADMAPSAKMIVYYINEENNELVVDSLSFNVEGAFLNKVTVGFEESDAKPADTVSLRVSAQRNSIVGLLAIDQSVLLLAKGNDITQQDVLTELEDYNGVDRGFKDDVFPCCFFWPRPIGGDDASTIISNSGLVVLTNALVYKKPVEIFPDFLAPPIFLRRVAFALEGQPGPVAVAFDSAPSPAPTSAANPRVRKFFPETWIWQNFTQSSSSLSITATVPDTITSWVASAFALHDSLGLGIAEQPTELLVFKQFFVSLNLPFSVVRGEEVVIQAIIFNYLAQDVGVRVDLPASDEYDSIEVDSSGRTVYRKAAQFENIIAKKGTGTPVFFPVVPRKLGQMTIRITASANLAADAVERELLIEAEGVEKRYTKNFLIDRTNSNTGSTSNGLEGTTELIVPPNAVEGSKRIDFTLIGNILGPALNGLDKLIKMPYGCGEQNMLNFAPTVFVTEYLDFAGLLTQEQRAKSVGFMEKGYQRELTYQRKDGSFSAFGNSDPSGSMWLTAFVIKSFQRADKFIFIDPDLMLKGVNWMISRQNSDGSFPEPGRVIHKSMMGGGADETKRKYTLTAYVLTALIEIKDGAEFAEKEAKKIQDSTNKAVRFLEPVIQAGEDHSDDLYLLSLLGYALQLAESPRAATVLTKLNQYATEEGGFKFWELPKPAASSRTDIWHPPVQQNNAIEIELAAYALLIYSEKGEVVNGLPILRWITTQRSENGGFSSTQDTVVGLQALSAFATFVSGNLNMNVRTEGNFPTSTPQIDRYVVNSDNKLVLQMNTFDPATTSVDLYATGSGMALVSFTVTYNEEEAPEDPAFATTAQVIKENKNEITVKVCTKWLLADSTGMAVMEVGIPTGFAGDVDALKKQNIPGIKRIEPQNRKLVIYWNEIGSSQICIEIVAQRTDLVAKPKPVAVAVYDYYEPEKRQTIFYSSNLLKNTNTCDVCQDCKGCDNSRR